MALILTDIDDTVLTWYKEFNQWLLKHKNFKAPENPLTWKLGKILGISETDADELVQEFNASEEFFNLKPCLSSQEYLPMLSQNHKIIGITSGSSNKINIEITKALRAANLERYFPGVFTDLYVLPLHGDKKPILNSFYTSLWVEDSGINAVKGLEAGHDVFIIDCPHNRDFNHSGMTRVKDWSDIYKILENE